MAEGDKDRPQVTQSSNSDEPSSISPLDIRSVSPLATGQAATSALASVRESIQRAARISDERDYVRDNPVPPKPVDKPSTNDHAVNDHAVLGLCEILALMFGLPPGEALFRGEPLSLRLVGFIVAGAFFAALGPGWPAVRKKFPQQTLVLSVGRIASDARYWLAIILVGFLYAASPEMYRRAVVPVAPVSSSPPVLCSDGPCAPVHLKPAPQYLKEIGLGNGPGQPLSFQGVPVVTSERLRVFVDYSEYRSGWMPKTRAFIGEFKEPVKGKVERLQLIYSATKENAGTNTLWWGDPSQNHAVTTPIYSSNIPAIIVRARVAIIGPGGEQHHYFMLVREAENIGTYVGVIPEHDSGDWIESWENE
jgi:hypothetical protein